MRKADAWRIIHDGGTPRVVTYEPNCEKCVVEPLYARTPKDRHTLLDAADFLEDLVMDEDDEADVLVKRLREMAGS